MINCYTVVKCYKHLVYMQWHLKYSDIGICLCVMSN
jgi:hypothetical protein